MDRTGANQIGTERIGVERKGLYSLPEYTKILRR